jgi:L-malate glycosyltransferase
MTFAPLREPAPLIVEGFYSFQIGGSERLAAALVLAFHERGYRVIGVSFYDNAGPIRDQLEAAGIRCVGFNFDGRYRLGRPLLQLELIRFFVQERPQVVHFQHALTLNLAGRAARFARVPRLVMTEHTDESLRRMPKYHRRSSRSCERVDLVTTVHARLAQYFVTDMGMPPNRVSVIRNGVAAPVAGSAASRTQARRQLLLAPDDFVFMFLGRFDKDKDIETLLRAAHLARMCGRTFRVALIGDGPERHALEMLADELVLQDIVKFIGARTDGRALLEAGDAFIMTSRTEGVPLALLEAMAQGLPCIATAVGGIPELLNDGCGILIEPHDPEATAQAMHAVLSNVALRKRIAAAGLARVRADYEFDATVTAYLCAFGLPARWGGA